MINLNSTKPDLPPFTAAESASEYPKYIYLLLYLIPLGTICGNVFVCLAVTLERRLRNRFNLFLVSLAISDMLCAVLIMPKSAWELIYGNEGQNWLLCLIWYSLDVFFTATTIIHLCVISIDRYLALRAPLMSTKMTDQMGFRLCARIAVAWLISFFIAGPLFILALLSAKQAGDSYKGCGPNSKDFVITATLVTFILPLCIMMLTYFLTIQSLKRQMREANEAQLYSKPSQQSRIRGGSKFWRLNRGSPECASFRIRKPSIGVEKLQRSPSANGANSRLLNRADSERCRMLSPVEEAPSTSSNTGKHWRFQQAVDHIRNLSHCSPSKRQQHQQHKKFELWRIVREYKEMMEQEDQRLELEWASVDGSYDEASMPGHRPTLDEQAQETRPVRMYSSPTKSSNRLTVSPSKSRHSSIVERFQNYSRNRNQQKNTLDRIHKGRKAMQVIGVLFGVFVTCYLPFFTLYLISVLCTSCEQWTKPWISRLEWLGYTGSMLNPFVYHFFNPAFRRTFRRILRCDLKSRNEHHRAVWLSKR